MSVLIESKLTNGIMAVEDLCPTDVLDTAEVMCSYCASEQSLSEMHYDFDDEEFICAVCAKKLLDGTMHDDDDVPSDLASCIDELGEDDFDAEEAL